MAEEHRCQAPRLCVNNCGFFGSPATQDLCSKCYRDLQLKEQQSSSAIHALAQTLVPPPPHPSSSPSTSFSSSSLSVPAEEEEEKEKVEVEVRAKRCLACKKRVGLTGFKCRCGMVFCGSHRYPEHHGCTFDYKGMGKDQIARANPVVKGDKLHKI